MEERELPEGWEWKRLGDIGKIISGVTYKSEEASDEPIENYIPILRAMNINGELIFNNLVFVPSERVSKQQFIRVDDIVIAMSSGSKAIVGKTAQAKEDFHGSFGAFCAVFRCNEHIDKKYVGLFFQTSKYRTLISHLSRGANINNLRKENFKSMLIALPPLPIQHQIVAVLEQAEAVKRQRKEADALTGALLQSVFYKIFGDPENNERGWDYAQLEELCSVITDGEHVTPRRTNSGIFLLSARNIQNHYISTSNVDFIDEEEYTRLSKHLIPKNGDVLVSCSGSVGRVTRVNVDYKFQLVRSVALMRPIVEKVDPIYLEYSFETQFMKNQLSSCVHQSSQANLFQGMIRKLKIPLPPLALQQQFARVVQDVERIREQQVASGRQIEGLCEGLMVRAFAGELVA